MLDVRWKPPCPRPEIPSDLDPKLERLLDTFWTSDPIWPELPEQAGPSSRPTVNEDSNRKSLHDLLNAVDPNEAGRWHWRDDRKVKRSLERWWERGGVELKVEPVGEKSGKGRRARFRTIIFWVYEPLQTLAPRLDKRVDKMIEVSEDSKRSTVSRLMESEWIVERDIGNERNRAWYLQDSQCGGS